MYVAQGTDQGLRLIAARMIARDATVAHSLVPAVTRKRSIAGALCVTAGLAYSVWGPMPLCGLCVGGLVVGTLPYSLSLDWLAWGLSQFGWLGLWRACVVLIITATSLLGFILMPDPRVALIVGNSVGSVVGSGALWILWRTSWQQHLQQPSAAIEDVARQLRGRPR